MRKFFSFKSSGSISTNCHENSLPPAPPSSDDMAYWKKLQDDHSNFSMRQKVQDLAQTLKDTTIEPQNQYPESENSSHLLHKRSRSLSSCAMESSFGRGNVIPFGDASRATSSYGYLQHHACNCQRDCHALIPERCTRSKSGNLFPLHSHAVEKYGSPSSLRDPKTISGNSPCDSPVLLRCTASHVSWYPKSKELLDRWTDGEDQEVNHKTETHSDKCLSEPEIACSLSEKRTYPSVGPLQVQSTAVPSLTRTKENISAYSSRKEEGTLHHISGRNWTRNDGATVSSLKHKKKTEEPPHAFFGKLTMNFQDCDSESSTTFEDIYMDSFESQPSSHSDDIAQHCSTENSPNSKKQSSYFAQDIVGLEKYEYSLENGSLIKRNGKITCYDPQDTDEEILKKLNEVEKMIDLLPNEDLDITILQSRNLDISSLIQTIRNIKEDKKYLLLGLSSQLKGRLTDRHAATKHIRQARREMNIRTRRLEREKNELQFSLEKELDERSNDWSVKIEKIQLEEQRLRVRVRELAEQNISLQREISTLKGTEMELANLTATLEQTRADNCKFQKDLLEMQERFNTTENDLDCTRTSFREQEKENKELQKLVVNLQRISNEQEMTINGLRLGYSEEIENKSTDGSDQLSRLQMEQLRLTGIEQNLRKELESCKHELQTLRHENMGLLHRLQATGNSHGFSSIKLDQELHARVDSLQTQGLSLLDDIRHFNGDLLGWLEHKQFKNGQEAEKETSKYLFVDYTIKSQSLSRRFENFRRSLQTIAKVLDDKSHSQAVGCPSQPVEGSMLKQSEGELEIQLKTEIILTRLLREKLYSNELELERLQADLTSSIRVHDVLQTEIQRMQDEVSYLTHKTTDTELQILQKDESIRQLDNKCQECAKELTAARNILLKITEERNHMWEEVKNSREKIMLLDCEVLSLKKRIEELDESILTKEGQISILRDSLEKPFDLIFSPRSVKEFSLE